MFFSLFFLYVTQFYIYPMLLTNIYSVPTENLGIVLDARNKKKHMAMLHDKFNQGIGWHAERMKVLI